MCGGGHTLINSTWPGSNVKSVSNLNDRRSKHSVDMEHMMPKAVCALDVFVLLNNTESISFLILSKTWNILFFHLSMFRAMSEIFLVLSNMHLSTDPDNVLIARCTLYSTLCSSNGSQKYYTRFCVRIRDV